jgi:hypothetical protein
MEEFDAGETIAAISSATEGLELLNSSPIQLPTYPQVFIRFLQVPLIVVL